METDAKENGIVLDGQYDWDDKAMEDEKGRIMLKPCVFFGDDEVGGTDAVSEIKHK